MQWEGKAWPCGSHDTCTPQEDVFCWAGQGHSTRAQATLGAVSSPPFSVLVIFTDFSWLVFAFVEHQLCTKYCTRNHTKYEKVKKEMCPALCHLRLKWAMNKSMLCLVKGRKQVTVTIMGRRRRDQELNSEGFLGEGTTESKLWKGWRGSGLHRRQ